MSKRTIVLCCLIIRSAAATASSDLINEKKFQPAITSATYPDVVVSGWSFANNVRRTGVRAMESLVPSYDGTGKLIASWNPQSDVRGHPTFVVMHGGHGVSPGNFQTAQWLMRDLRANVLILDSYLSRGRQENWRTWTEFGANMRVLDAIAAGRFLASRGADPDSTFILGDSQGGWAALRVFTRHEKENEVRRFFKGGIALYPNCYAKESAFSAIPNGATDPDYAPPLGPYFAPLIIFTGTEDTATPVSLCNVSKALKSAEHWIEFKGATHAWDAPNRGAGNRAVDGECTTAPNEFNRFRICRSDKFTEHTYSEIAAFVARHAKQQTTPTVLPESDVDRRTQEILEELGSKR